MRILCSILVWVLSATAYSHLDLKIKGWSHWSPPGLPGEYSKVFKDFRCTNVIRESKSTQNDLTEVLNRLEDLEDFLDERYPDKKGRKHRVVFPPAVHSTWYYSYRVFFGKTDPKTIDSFVTVLDRYFMPLPLLKNSIGSFIYRWADSLRLSGSLWEERNVLKWPSSETVFLAYALPGELDSYAGFGESDPLVREYWIKAMHFSKAITEDEIPVFVPYIGLKEAKIWATYTPSGGRPGAPYDLVESSKRTALCPSAVLFEDLFEPNEGFNQLKERYALLKWNTKSRIMRQLTEYDFDYRRDHGWKTFFADEAHSRMAGFYKEKAEESINGFNSPDNWNLELIK